MKRIYCDGIFDLFHLGQLKYLQKIHDYFSGEKINLIVGIISDDVSTVYKRKPILNETQRLKIIKSCLYTTTCFITNMLTITEEFMNEYQIDYVIYALDNSNRKKQSVFFDVPRKMNKFIELDYNVGISTTQIIEQYHNNKPNITINQIKRSRPLNILKNIQKRIGLNSHSNILEIGIEDDLLSKYVGASNYICLDTNIFNTTKILNTSPYIALNLSPVYKIFSTFCFNYIIINNPWTMDIYKILDNIENTSKNGIYICNIMDDSEHMNEQMFINRGYTVVKSGFIGFDAYINFE
jgi:cytidyltransferase-like protein